MKKIFLLAAAAGIFPLCTAHAAVTQTTMKNSAAANLSIVNTGGNGGSTSRSAPSVTYSANVTNVNSGATSTSTSKQPTYNTSTSTGNFTLTSNTSSSKLNTLTPTEWQTVKVSDLSNEQVSGLSGSAILKMPTTSQVSLVQREPAVITKLEPSQQLTLVKDQLNDSSANKVTLTPQIVLDRSPNLQIVGTIAKKIPCVEFDAEIVEPPEIQVKYDLDNNGLKMATLTEAEFKPFISVEKYPQLYKITDWDPETEVINPLTNRVAYCTRYSNKCRLDTTLIKNYITNRKIRKLKLCDNNLKVLPIIDMKCVGVKCGKGQECVNGCCEYQETTTANVTLRPALQSKYEIKGVELIAKPVALKDETAKLFLDNPAVEKEVLDSKVLMEKATNTVQGRLQALKPMMMAQ